MKSKNEPHAPVVVSPAAFIIQNVVKLHKYRNCITAIINIVNIYLLAHLNSAREEDASV